MKWSSEEWDIEEVTGIWWTLERLPLSLKRVINYMFLSNLSIAKILDNTSSK